MFVEAEDVTGAGLASLLETALTNLGLSLAQCRGQGYDGEAAMMGRFKGVRTIIQEKQPLAVHTHCFAHRLNLSVSSSCELPISKNVFGTVATIIDFFSYGKRAQALEQMELKAGGDEMDKKNRLKRYNPTRWVERHESLATFVDALPRIVHVLKDMSNSRDCKTSALAASLLRSVLMRQFLIGLFVADRLLSYVAPLSRKLQTVDLNIGQAMKLVYITVAKLQEIRTSSHEVFKDIYEKTVKTASPWGTTFEKPRVVDRQTMRENVECANVEDYFRRSAFIPFTDFLIAELNDRFSNPSKAYQLQELIPGFMTPNAECNVLDAVKDYVTDLPYPLEVVRCEVEMWTSAIRRSGQVYTSLSSSINEARSMGLECIVTLLRVFGTIPVTTATAERSFSRQKLLKTWLRSTVSQDRLNALTLLSMKTAVDSESVINLFKEKKRRLVL